MIRSVVSNSSQIITSHTTSAPYISDSMGSGQVRYFAGNFQVFNGNSWVNASSDIDISLSSDVTTILEWVRVKKTEEENAAKLETKYPSLKSAREQYDMIKTMCISEELNGITYR